MGSSESLHGTKGLVPNTRAQSQRRWNEDLARYREVGLGG